MADRIEREIEEILARLDKELPPDGAKPADRAPISLASRKKKHTASKRLLPRRRSLSLERVTPANLLFAGAGVMVIGLIVSTVWAQLIWLAFAGVVVFLLAFAWSFFRTPRAAASAGPGGHYWRDRYIEYTPQKQSVIGRLRRRFHR